MKIYNPFKKRAKKPDRPLPNITTTRDAEFITIDRVKSALSDNDFNEIITLFELFLDRDLKIAEGVEKRQNSITALPYTITAGAEEQRVIDRVLSRVPMSRWLYTLADGIYYGYSLLEPKWGVDSIEGGENLLIPQSLTHYAPTLLKHDEEKKRHYILTTDNKKLYIDTLHPRLLKYDHAREGDNIQNRALAYKLLYYALLKHVSIGYNIQYFDSLAVPPLIIQSADISDKEQIDALTTALMALKSNSYGIFPGDITVDSLKVGSQADFLSLVEYFDSLIAQYIVGATSISDGKAGSLALAKAQEERFREKISFDAKRIQEGITDIFNLILSMNLSSFTPVTVELSVERRSTPEEFATIVKDLSAGGYQIEEAEIEKRLGVKIKRTVTTEKNNQTPHHIEYNSTTPSKPLSIQESIMQSEDSTDIEEELKRALTLLEGSSSFEEALIAIEKWDNPKLEEALLRLIWANSAIGLLEDRDDG